MLFCASAFFASAAAQAAPPIAYGLVNGTKMDLYLTNPDGSGKVLLYSTANKVNIGMVDMDPSANRLALVQSDFSGFFFRGQSKWGTVDAIANELGLNKPLVRKLVVGLISIPGRTVIGHSRDFYCLRDVQKAFTNLLKKKKLKK